MRVNLPEEFSLGRPLAFVLSDPTGRAGERAVGGEAGRYIVVKRRIYLPQ